MYFGSIYGIFFYLSGFAIVAIYSIILYNAIIANDKDRFKSIMASNDFSADFNSLEMNDLNFMPFFEIRELTAAAEKFDIFSDSHSNEGVNWDNYLKIDYQKLSKYL